MRGPAALTLSHMLPSWAVTEGKAIACEGHLEDIKKYKSECMHSVNSAHSPTVLHHSTCLSTAQAALPSLMNLGILFLKPTCTALLPTCMWSAGFK